MNTQISVLAEHIDQELLDIARQQIASETAGMTDTEKAAFVKGLKFAAGIIAAPLEQQIKVQMIAAMIVAEAKAEK